MISRILVLLAMLTLFPHLAFAQQQGQVKCVRDNAGNIYCPKRQPVDLSRIGLEGIETANRTRESQARIEALEAQTRAYEAQQRRDNAAPPKQAIAASPAIRKQAAYAYEPYIFCVIDNARSFSAGPDTATDIATAAVTACSAKKWESYEVTLRLEINGERLDRDTADQFRSDAQQRVHAFGVAAVIQERAK